MFKRKCDRVEETREKVRKFRPREDSDSEQLIDENELQGETVSVESASENLHDVSESSEASTGNK